MPLMDFHGMVDQGKSKGGLNTGRHSWIRSPGDIMRLVVEAPTTLCKQAAHASSLASLEGCNTAPIALLPLYPAALKSREALPPAALPILKALLFSYLLRRRSKATPPSSKVGQDI